MRFRRQITALAFILVTIAILILTGSVLAHEGREVGDYDLVFGWRSEPALVGFPNGPELFIRPRQQSDAANPLEGIDISLQVEVTFGPASRTLELRPMFGEPDHYIADLIPTRPGDYAFRVFGAIGDMTIDEVFTSADGRFGTVEPAGDVTFPDDLPSLVTLLERIAELEARLAALEGGE